MAYADFQLSYQVCPIVLIGGIAGTGVLPIASLLNPGQSSQNVQEVTSATSDFNVDPTRVSAALDAFTFGSFRVLPGGTLMDNENAKYPLATMSVAANAIVTNPLRLAVEMVTPASGDVTFSQRLSIFTSLKNVLDHHIAAGGYFNVATPAFIYTGCLLLNLVDASDVPEGAQTQTRWVWNFEQPLITLRQAEAAVNVAMGKVTGQTYNAGQPPGKKPLLTSVSSPSVGQQITPGADNAAGTTQTIPIAPSTFGGTGNYV
jgi:hypothetical protein